MRTGKFIRLATLLLVLDLFVFPWSGEVWNGYWSEPGPKAFQSGFWAWGGCVTAIVGAVLSLVARRHATDARETRRALRLLALLLGVLGFTLVAVQAVTEGDRSFGLYSAVVASALVTVLTYIDYLHPAIEHPDVPRAESVPTEDGPPSSRTSSRVKATVIVVLVGLALIASLIASAISASWSGEGRDANGQVVGVSLALLLLVVAIWWDRRPKPATVTDGGDLPVTTGEVPPVDPCTLLTLAEVRTLAPGATEPTGPGQLPNDSFTQCNWGASVAVQVYGPTLPGFFAEGAEFLGQTIVEVGGIGAWARAYVNQADPQLGLEEMVGMVAAGNTVGTVTIFPLIPVYPGAPEHEALLTLLELALSRL